MKKSAVVLIVLGVLLFGVLVVALSIGGVYNGMVSKSQAADQAWAQVQNDYQRRADLIPNLVATVKGAANFESSTLEAVTTARASVGQVKIDPNQRADGCGPTGGVPEGPGWIVVGVIAVAGGVGELPEINGHGQFPRFAGATGGHGKPDYGIAAGF